MKKSVVKVTDHAVVRYMERALGVNVEGLRRRIGRRADKAFKAGASSVTIDGLRYTVRNGALVTVSPACKSKRRRIKRK